MCGLIPLHFHSYKVLCAFQCQHLIHFCGRDCHTPPATLWNDPGHFTGPFICFVLFCSFLCFCFFPEKLTQSVTVTSRYGIENLTSLPPPHILTTSRLVLHPSNVPLHSCWLFFIEVQPIANACEAVNSMASLQNLWYWPVVLSLSIVFHSIPACPVGLYNFFFLSLTNLFLSHPCIACRSGSFK